MGTCCSIFRNAHESSSFKMNNYDDSSMYEKNKFVEPLQNKRYQYSGIQAQPDSDILTRVKDLINRENTFIGSNRNQYGTISYREKTNVDNKDDNSKNLKSPVCNVNQKKRTGKRTMSKTQVQARERILNPKYYKTTLQQEYLKPRHNFGQNCYVYRGGTSNYNSNFRAKSNSNATVSNGRIEKYWQPLVKLHEIDKNSLKTDSNKLSASHQRLVNEKMSAGKNLDDQKFQNIGSESSKIKKYNPILHREMLKTRMIQELNEKWNNAKRISSKSEGSDVKNLHKDTCTNAKCACKILNDKQLTALQNKCIPGNELLGKAFPFLCCDK